MEARTLTPSEKGGIAELAIAAAAVKAGIPVLRPLVEGLRYDLAFELPSGLARVQCKWGAIRDGVIRVQLAGSRHTPGRGYVRSRYTADEIDMVAVYCSELDRVYVVPIADIAGRDVPPSSASHRPGTTSPACKLGRAV